MTTTDEIIDMFMENVKKFEKNPREKPRVIDKRVRDKESDIYVTDLCVYTTYCPRSVYYNKVVQRPINPRKILRYTAGHYVHDIPINAEENEVSFQYMGYRCRMDDISSKDGWIADKKTVSYTPMGAKEYVTKQLNVYKTIAENNEAHPFKVNDLFVVSININSGETTCHRAEVWDSERTIKFMKDVREEILNYVRNRTLPDIKNGWWCEECQYLDLCKKNAIEDAKQIAKDLLEQKTIDDFNEKNEQVGTGENIDVIDVNLR